MKFFLLMSFLVFAIGCSDTRLGRSIEANSVKSQGYFCTQSPQFTSGITKFMFVIDKSGSNVTGGPNGTGTDPNNVKRADNIERFFNGPPNSPRRDNPNIAWGYIAFAEDGVNFPARAFINDGDEQSPIFVKPPDNVVAMNQALQMQRNEPDNGGTPYKAAIALTRKAIVNDVEKNPTETHNYVIFFVSDGRPTDYGPEAPAGPETFRDVQDLVNTVPGRVTFSTAYYGPASDTEAAEGLRKMAVEYGHGKFVNTNTVPDFDIDDLLNNAGSHADTYQVNKILVYNVNSTVCWDKKRIGVDSDADGLCDEDEISITKTDPQNRYTFGDGYSDYLHYMAVVTQSFLPTCFDRSDEDNDLLTACEELYMFNAHPIKPTPKKADPINPDTDYDWFIDGIEFLMLKNKSAPVDQFNLFKSFDGEPVNAGEQIVQHRNPLVYDFQLAPPDIYDTRIEFDKYNAEGQSCYHFNQDSLKLYRTRPVPSQNTLGALYAHKEWENVVLVYFIQSLEKDPNGAGYYASSVQTLNGHPGITQGRGFAAGLQIHNGTFTLFPIPEPKEEAE